MIGLSFTLDYEISGSGDGNVADQIIIPTRKYAGICEEFGVKSTIFVEVAELIKMKEHAAYSRDITSIETQLRRLHQAGHDIQLHIHPWWSRATFDDHRWELDYTRASLGQMEPKEIKMLVKQCRDYLIALLNGKSPPYACTSFRAGSWAMMPTRKIFDALIESGIKVDSSVFKGGVFNSRFMSFDFRDAYSNIVPWHADPDDINQPVPFGSQQNNSLLEVPIFCVPKRGYQFLTLKRMRLRKRVRSAIMDNNPDREKNSNIKRIFDLIKLAVLKRPMKLDFCKCSLGELKQMTRKFIRYNQVDKYLPVVAIGHSKDFVFENDFRAYVSYLKREYEESVEIVPLTEAVSKYLNHQ